MWEGSDACEYVRLAAFVDIARASEKTTTLIRPVPLVAFHAMDVAEIQTVSDECVCPTRWCWDLTDSPRLEAPITVAYIAPVNGRFWLIHVKPVQAAGLSAENVAALELATPPRLKMIFKSLTLCDAAENTEETDVSECHCVRIPPVCRIRIRPEWSCAPLETPTFVTSIDPVDGAFEGHGVESIWGRLNEYWTTAVTRSGESDTIT